MALKILLKLVLAAFSFFALVSLTEILVPWGLVDRVLALLLTAWLVPLISLEILWLWRNYNPFPRLLSHLRFAPIAIFVSFVVITLSFDAAMIRYSKYEIRSYVYSNTPPDKEVSFDLHNNYRGWCGNGHSANEYYLYADTAAEGFTHEDPAIRARSLKASVEIYDWLNGVHEGPFLELIRKAANDEDRHVRQIASEFLESRRGWFGAASNR